MLPEWHRKLLYTHRTISTCYCQAYIGRFRAKTRQDDATCTQTTRQDTGCSAPPLQRPPGQPNASTKSFNVQPLRSASPSRDTSPELLQCSGTVSGRAHCHSWSTCDIECALSSRCSLVWRASRWYLSLTNGESCRCGSLIADDLRPCARRAAASPTPQRQQP